MKYPPARSLVFVLALVTSLALLHGCTSTPDEPTTDNVPAAMYGTWDYWTVTRTPYHGSPMDAVITGTLAFGYDKRWTMSRDIGGVITNAAGGFSVDSGKVMLKWDGRDSTDTYKYVLSNEVYKSGTRKTLTMAMFTNDSTYYKYSLKEHF